MLARLPICQSGCPSAPTRGAGEIDPCAGRAPDRARSAEQKSGRASFRAQFRQRGPPARTFHHLQAAIPQCKESGDCRAPSRCAGRAPDRARSAEQREDLGVAIPHRQDFPSKSRFHGRPCGLQIGASRLSESQNGFADGKICSRRSGMSPESLRGTHFERTVGGFEFAPGRSFLARYRTTF